MGTYRRILTIFIPMVFQRVTMSVGNDGVGVWNIMTDVGNDVIDVWRTGVDVRNAGVGIHNVVADISMSINLEFRLEAEN